MYNKILLTGINGQVGHELQRVFSEHHALFGELVCLDRNQLDLSDQQAIRDVVQTIKPDLIINPAAYTAVDNAETEPELAYAINAVAPGVLAAEAAKLGARLIHFSTDYVYAGNKVGLYVEDDATAPLSVYGKSKLAGEEAIRSVGLPHLIFRTSWVYGAYGKNFLNTILRLAKERDQLRIVADQVGAPTSSYSIADTVVNVLDQWQGDASGIYHLVNAGYTTWHGFAIAIVEEYSRLEAVKGWQPLKAQVENIQAITTADYPTPAVRPANSRLDCSRLLRDFSISIPDWREALIAELQALPLANN
ncbi:MAG: dTDP-4-dehydrorhamnose reductase [Methylotenera sp.]|uniref:dTDP-4-dehydrorhamnose reductase n=1 Tax=Methylotenera sp. TaxID=2051956 RepID=UPI00271E5104|nr:dTDP-4-dehydrorhamnose reductase [Methylotenera sp.]MDO9151948.1 dTDP-4-dehydrorhamnose reductase [Methylotenera sp.]